MRDQLGVGRQRRTIVANVNEHGKQVRREEALEHLAVALHAEEVAQRAEHVCLQGGHLLGTALRLVSIWGAGKENEWAKLLTEQGTGSADEERRYPTHVLPTLRR